MRYAAVFISGIAVTLTLFALSNVLKTDCLMVLHEINRVQALPTAPDPDIAYPITQYRHDWPWQCDIRSGGGEWQSARSYLASLK